MRRIRRHARWIAAAAAAVVIVLAVYLLFLSDTEVEPRLTLGLPTSTIGEGDGAVGVTADGTVLAEGPPPTAELPRLPIAEPPKGNVLRGTLLEQATVLGAAPSPLRPCIESSRYGESGIDVVLRSGIEISFGTAARAADKWRAAVAILADPELTELDYVNVQSPRRPSSGGSGHTLPAPGEGSGSGCGG